MRTRSTMMTAAPNDPRTYVSCWMLRVSAVHTQEYCDRGSLLGAIRRGIFRMDDGASPPPSSLAIGGGGGASSVTPAAGEPSTASSGRFPRRIVLRGLLRTARDIAQVGELR